LEEIQYTDYSDKSHSLSAIWPKHLLTSNS